MQISAKADYALKAVVFLGLKNGRLAQAGDIAAGESIPLKFLEQILLDLKRAGIVSSKRGIGGGYALALAPESITVGSIIGVFDHSFGPVGGIERMREPATLSESELALRPTWLKLAEAVSGILDKTTLDKVIEEHRCTAKAVQTVTHGTAWF
ncbi:MAG: RrF2 family transcriptional regulator [Candidatus Aquicultorales bacterium]